MMELQGVVDYQAGDIDGTVVIEPKLDGWGCIARWQDGVPVLYTRNHVEIPLPHIQRECALLMPQGYFFHGELIHPEGFEAIKSAIARQSESLHFHVFDMVDEAFFEEGFDPRPYQERRWELCMTFRFANTHSDDNVHHVLSVRCRQDEIDDMSNEYLEAGYEGSVVKRLESLYASGPTGDWMRIKPVSTADCVVMGVVESDVEPGSIRSLIVRTDDGIVTRVGTGMDDRTRRILWQKRQAAIGQLVEVSYRGTYKSGKMRHAAFVRPRPDKSASPAPQQVLV